MNIVVTGASSGIGYEAVLQLLRHGDNSIVAIARSGEKLQRLLEENNERGNLYTLPFDIVHDDYENVLVPFIKKKLKHIDVLINNAGLLINKPFKELTSADFAQMTETNFLGQVKMTSVMLPLMNKGSHIVNIGSMGGYQGSVKFPGLSAYSASKAALHIFTECLAQELVDDQVKVNCLALGSAQTEMLAEAFPGYSSPVSAKQMGKYVAEFAMNGHHYFNGKIVPVSVTTP
jgi:NAD(P)-dependent dehydrogenase (short-subunit alcohol dehydrogenase family)